MNHDQVSSGVLLVIGAATCLGALSYDLGGLSSPGAGFMPFLSGLAMILFSGIGFIHGSIRRKKGERWILLLQGLQWKKAALILLALTAYALLLEPLGFLTCTVFFIAFLLRAIVPQRWPVVIMGGLAAALASYLIFEIWLQAQLPKGPWGV